MALVFVMALAYLVGCFPSGFLVSKFYNTNIATQGSGNVGATNVARVLGSKAGVITLLLDVFKGAIGASVPYLMGTLLTVPYMAFDGLLEGGIIAEENSTFLASIFTLAGHCFALPGLKGGKGVATSFGVLLCASPLLALCTATVFTITFAISRIVSLSSINAALILPLASYCLAFSHSKTFLVGVMTIIVCYRHSPNIIRLIEGTEKKFTKKKHLQ
jgi:acyl phosphate:glycerol-3-phosphate acyltransferase